MTFFASSSLLISSKLDMRTFSLPFVPLPRARISFSCSGLRITLVTFQPRLRRSGVKWRATLPWPPRRRTCIVVSARISCRFKQYLQATQYKDDIVRCLLLVRGSTTLVPQASYCRCINNDVVILRWMPQVSRTQCLSSQGIKS